MIASLLQIGPLLVAWTAVVASPGPNFVNTIHFASRDSAAAGVRVALGVALGTFIWSTAATTVLGILFGLFPWAVDALRVIGGLFLAVLALRILVAAFRERSCPADNVPDVIRPGSPLLVGLVSDLANPKAALFWSSIMATALPPDAPVVLRLICIVAVTAIAFSWYALLAWTFNLAAVRRAYLRYRTQVDVVSGLVLLALAAGVAFT